MLLSRSFSGMYYILQSYMKPLETYSESILMPREGGLKWKR